MSDGKPFAISADRTTIHAKDTGAGRPIVVVHGGMQAAMRWDDVAARLPGWRLVAIERRVYGRSGPPQSPHAVAREVEDVAAVLDAIGEPAILLGHSSGAMVALEAALALQDKLAGLFVYEPPTSFAGPVFDDAQARCERAMAAGNRDEALRIFFTEIVQLPEPWVTYMRTDPAFAGGWGEMKRLAAAQMEDNRALRAVRPGIATYAAITVPTLLYRGDQSPQHLQDSITALSHVIPHSEVVTLIGHGHGANLEAPDEMAAAIDRFAVRVFGQRAASAA